MKISEIKTSDIIRVADIESLFQRPVNYDDIKADILQHGIQELIVVNTKNELLCGYTRLAIAEELGIDYIPSQIVNISDMGAMIKFAKKAEKKYRKYLNWKINKSI
jgi:ParB-like chromosome segregation protein Spo0J